MPLFHFMIVFFGSHPDRHRARSLLTAIALARCAASGTVAIVTAMLEPDSGAQLDARDENGFTAIHHACTCGHGEVALLLAERGAPPRAQPAPHAALLASPRAPPASHAHCEPPERRCELRVGVSCGSL